MGGGPLQVPQVPLDEEGMASLTVQAGGVGVDLYLEQALWQVSLLAVGRSGDVGQVH